MKTRIRDILDLLPLPLRLPPQRQPRAEQPVALVYRGPAALPGCAEAVAGLLESSRWGFAVRYVGPDGQAPLNAAVLADATVYAQPGGGTLSHGYRHMRRHRNDIRQFVRTGGAYLGFCLGGYLAGATPGFKLLPGDTDQYIASRAATIDTEDNALVQVQWRGRRLTMFFQDGPHFLLDPDADALVLATYPNDTIAALVTRFGSGRVGVVGPHPEATDDWYTGLDIVAPEGLSTQLGLDLVDTVMRP